MKTCIQIETQPIGKFLCLHKQEGKPVTCLRVAAKVRYEDFHLCDQRTTSTEKRTMPHTDRLLGNFRRKKGSVLGKDDSDETKGR